MNFCVALFQVVRALNFCVVFFQVVSVEWGDVFPRPKAPEPLLTHQKIRNVFFNFTDLGELIDLMHPPPLPTTPYKVV